MAFRSYAALLCCCAVMLACGSAALAAPTIQDALSGPAILPNSVLILASTLAGARGVCCDRHMSAAISAMWWR